MPDPRGPKCECGKDWLVCRGRCKQSHIDSNPVEALAANLPSREHPAGLSRRERLAFAVLDEVAALRADVERLTDENARWKATYNDLVGRIPQSLLDDINRGAQPHRHELPDPEKDALRAERNDANELLREWARLDQEYSNTTDDDPVLIDQIATVEFQMHEYVERQEAIDACARRQGSDGE